MRSVLIVGAGQSGLLLGLWLRARDYDVTIATDRTAEQVAGGSILSTQVMFGPALAIEREAGLDFWQGAAPGVHTLEFSLVDPVGESSVTWSGRLPQPAQSVDQRTKFARWMREFTDGGGHLETGRLTVDAVDERSRTGDHDLVVVAAAGALAALFPTDALLTPPGGGPRRTLSAIYLRGVEPAGGCGQYTSVPGCGEIITVPALTGDTLCHTMLVEALPGGPWDRFGELAGDPETHVAEMLGLLSTYAPAVHERYQGGCLTDPGARLVGAFAPVVRHPLVTLPSGRVVVGMGDTVCRMDPLGAQGANTATRCAARFGAAIESHGDRPFDEEWMLATAGDCWERFAGPAVAWTELLLDPPPLVQEVIGAAGRDQALADALASGFAEPAAVSALVGTTTPDPA
jgi:hypothetical protein